MAFRALVPFVTVFATVDREVHIVVIKSSRCPGGVGVAVFATRRELRGGMAGVGGAVVISYMTSGAGGRCTGVPTGVAIDTIRILVGTVERKGSLIVVKIFECIARRMTGQAGVVFVGIPTDALVAVVGLGVGVAVGTTEFRKICRVGMAIRTGRPYPVVCPRIDGEMLGVVARKVRRHPIGRGGMASRTIVGNTRTGMVGSRSSRKICLVASHALIGRIGKITADMTPVAIGNVMALRQRKKIVVADLVGTPARGKHIVALDAVGREATFRVVGHAGIVKINLVAIDTIIAEAIKTQGRF